MANHAIPPSRPVHRPDIVISVRVSPFVFGVLVAGAKTHNLPFDQLVDRFVDQSAIEWSNQEYPLEEEQ